MKTKLFNPRTSGLAVGALLLAAAATSWAGKTLDGMHTIDGITGPSFTFTAKGGHVSTSEGNSIYFWGFANGSGANAVMQYPGPTMIVNQGDAVTVTLYNELPVPVSIIFPGQSGVVASGGVAGLLTQEAPAGTAAAPGGPVTVTFTASQPGTYLYQSGTRQDLQVEMGLVGALIVRPTGFNADVPANRRAYNHDDSLYAHEHLFLLTDMDENIHDTIEHQVLTGLPIAADMTKWYPQYWFINGRSGTDTLLPAGAPWLPHQPYDAIVLIKPKEKVLQRVIGAGRDSHPFHHHGNDGLLIARDGRLLSSTPTTLTAGADLAYPQFTVPASPGSTWDQIFEWTGEKLGWDIYGHAPGDPMAPGEYEPDHGKAFPVRMPSQQDVTFGMLYSGSPFLGSEGQLPPGEGGFNPGVFMYMWHSHSERELCDGNIFPGGMLTFCLIAAP